MRRHYENFIWIDRKDDWQLICATKKIVFQAKNKKARNENVWNCRKSESWRNTMLNASRTEGAEVNTLKWVREKKYGVSVDDFITRSPWSNCTSRRVPLTSLCFLLYYKTAQSNTRVYVTRSFYRFDPCVTSNAWRHEIYPLTMHVCAEENCECSLLCGIDLCICIYKNIIRRDRVYKYFQD